MHDVRGMTAGILVRISDDREGRALGVRRQEEDGRHLADRMGLRVVRVYVENSISASTIAGKNRQDFEDFLADWKAGIFDVPLAYTTGRLTRDNIVAERIIEVARAKGISPYFVASPWCDLSTAAGRRMYRSLAVNDAAEAEDIQERAQRKKLQDAKDGKTNGGPRTYGYGKVIGTDPKSGKEICDPYQVREEEIDVLQEGKRRLLAGDSQLKIVMDWNLRGIKTARAGVQIKRGDTKKPCDGLWTVGKFARTMLNPSYIIFPGDNPEQRGTRVHKGQHYMALWPGVFTQQEHDWMRAILNSQAQQWSHGPVKGRTYMLTGIIHCGGTWPEGTDKAGQLCDGAMYGQGKRDGGKYKRRYACRKYDNHGVRVGCCTVFRIAEPVELLVSEAVLARFDVPEIACALAPADNESRMAHVVQELAQLTSRRQTLAEEYASGVHDLEDYKVMRDMLKTKIEMFESERKSLMNDNAKKLALPTEGLREVWAEASMEWKASVVRLLVKKVIIHPGRPGAGLWNGYRFDPNLVEILWRV